MGASASLINPSLVSWGSGSTSSKSEEGVSKLIVSTIPFLTFYSEEKPSKAALALVKSSWLQITKCEYLDGDEHDHSVMEFYDLFYNRLAASYPESELLTKNLPLRVRFLVHLIKVLQLCESVDSAAITSVCQFANIYRSDGIDVRECEWIF